MYYLQILQRLVTLRDNATWILSEFRIWCTNQSDDQHQKLKWWLCMIDDTPDRPIINWSILIKYSKNAYLNKVVGHWHGFHHCTGFWCALLGPIDNTAMVYHEERSKSERRCCFTHFPSHFVRLVCWTISEACCYI